MKEDSDNCPFCITPCGYSHCPYTKEETDDNFTDNILRIDKRIGPSDSDKDGENREQHEYTSYIKHWGRWIISTE